MNLVRELKSIDRKKTKKIAVISIFLYLILFLVVILFSKGIGGKRLAFNATKSLDGYLYLVDENKKNLAVGSVVAFKAPEQPFYSNRNFLKEIWGVPGDTVSFDQHGMFYINGELKGRAKRLSDYKGGTVLIQSEGGEIEEDYYFVGTNHPQSFDSRYKYIGNVNEKDIIGNASLIF